ncbi:MAG: glycosyltransferase [Planctomycetota bacterium]
MNYIANVRIPSERAHGLQIFKMCEAFMKSGEQLCLVYPVRVQSQSMHSFKDPFQYYEIQQRFRLQKVFCVDLQGWLEAYVSPKIGHILFVLQASTFAFFATLYCGFSREKICFTRDLYFAIFFSFVKKLFHKKMFFEEHMIPGKHHRLYQKMLMKTDGIFVLTSLMKQELETMGIPSEKIRVAPDACSPFPEYVAFPQEFLPFQEQTRLVYTGHLMPWKGVYTLAQAMKYLPSHYSCFFIGGLPKDIQAMKDFITQEQIPNCHLLGHFPIVKIPEFLAAATILVLPNTAKEVISQKYTSPLKLFEYLSAEKPIIASDLPSLREILIHNHNAWLVPPDDPKALAEGILFLKNHLEIVNALAKQAKKESPLYTWENRALRLLEFIYAS